MKSTHTNQPLPQLPIWKLAFTLALALFSFTNAQAQNTPKLQSLVVQGYALTPAFSPDRLDYTITVPAGVSGVKLTATLADSRGILFVNNNRSTSGALVNGSLYTGSISVQATSSDWKKNTLYRITAIRGNSPPPPPPPATYTLTVTNGTGSGSYSSGTRVSITASPAPTGQEFAAWITANSSILTSPTSSSTTITMPAANTTVTATYRAVTPPPPPPPATYALNVVNGLGSGSYTAGTPVTIIANAAPSGQTFDGWETANLSLLANANSPTTTLTMPAAATSVTATFAALPPPPPPPSGNTVRLNHEGRNLGPLPTVLGPILFNTPEADAIMSALQIYPTTHAWNEDVSRLPLLPNSAAMIAQINADFSSSRRNVRILPEMNFVLIPDNQPAVPINFVAYASESDPSPYPIPANTPVELWPESTGSLTNDQWARDINNTGGDRHFIIIQPGTGSVWETWNARKLSDTSWQAANGAKFNLNSNSLRPFGWTSGDAAGLSMLGGLIRYDECQRGVIEHALRIIVARSRNEYLYPATHRAGSTNDPNVPAMGQRLRLRADFPIPDNWTRESRAVAVALKKYGAIVADNGSFFSISRVPDTRFAPGAFNQVQSIPVTAFEVVQGTTANGGPRAPGAPTVNAGPDLNAVLNQPATLAGSGSSPTLTYEWRLLSGPGGVTFTTPNLAVTQASFTATGAYTVLLKGANTTHAPAYDTVNITVTDNGLPPPPPPPIFTYNLTVVNGSGSGTYAPGANITLSANAPLTGQQFANWSGASVTSPTSASTTLVMPSAHTTVTANYSTIVTPPAPPPVDPGTPPATDTNNGHPRLWITTADLPRLRSWATSTNPVYQNGLRVHLQTEINVYNTRLFPNGQPASSFPDSGGIYGYDLPRVEEYAMLFAFHALIDPSPTARLEHARRARTCLMHVMNAAAQGAASGQPFRDARFSINDRARFIGEALPLAVDWLQAVQDDQGNPVLTTADKATIRTVFLRWCRENIRANTNGDDHPRPQGVTNSLQLLPNNNAYTAAANNYYLGHARNLTMMSLALDAVDDPAVNSAQDRLVFENSVGSYLRNATGAWLYQIYAMFGDPATVRADYGLPANARVGIASGGCPPEGAMYGRSLAFLVGKLLALESTGHASVQESGPQAKLSRAAVWDRHILSTLTSLTPAARSVPEVSGTHGPVYQFVSYGDSQRLWITPENIQALGMIGLLKQKTGQTQNLDAIRWFMIHATPGGQQRLLQRITNPWSTIEPMLYFLLLDPNAPAPIDPRPSLPTHFYDATQGRLVEHTEWSPSASVFDFRCSWISINHQQADANSFGLYRNGEWLTKPIANYDDTTILGITTAYNNNLSIKNRPNNGASTPGGLGWWEPALFAEGSQWTIGRNAGDPTATVSITRNYTFAQGDATKLYNKPSVWTPENALEDITHASRSMIWLKPDHVVIYDRATSRSDGMHKRFNLGLNTAVAPKTQGNYLGTRTSGGQELHVTTLLPESVTVNTSTNLVAKAQLEPCTHRVSIQANGDPRDARFLHVLQGSDAGGVIDPTTLIRSTGGTSYEGALVHGHAVLFKRDFAAAATSVTYSVPADTQTHIVTGLAPATGYTVSTTPAGNQTQVTITQGGTRQTDSAGVLSF